MNWFNEKGASLGITITLAVLAAVIICALFVSCGRTHSSGVGAGSKPAHQSPGNVARAGLEPAPTIPLTDALKQIDAYVPPKGVDAARFESLKAELKRLLIERDRRGEAVPRPWATHRVAPTNEPTGDGKTLSIAPAGTMNAVTDLAATVNPDGTQATLTWTEVLPGDYDNNGVVDIGDLIPLALYYGQRTDSGADDAHRLVNGDADPEINIWDLGAIAGNYAAHLEGYQVWRGHWNGSSTDWETSFLPNTGNPTNTAFSIDRPSPPPISTRPAYTYTDDISGLADKNNVRYKVTAYGDGAAGADSNEAAVPATTFSVSGRVTVQGSGLAGVTLTLAPGSMHATTQADGTYCISGVANGVYTLTPTGTGYVFTPASIPVTVNGANVVGLDFAATGGLADSAWPKFHGNAQNTGQSPYIGAQTNHLKWTLATGGRVFSSPAIGADGTIYVGSEDHRVYALNPADGSVSWAYATGDRVVCSPAIGVDGTVYVGSYDNSVYALNPSDGSVRWTHTVGGYVGSSPAIGADGTVYVGSSDHNVYALNPSDGSVKWSYASGNSVSSSPAIGADGTVYIGSEDHHVYALNPADGSVKWTHSTNDYVESSPAIGADGTVYVGSDDGNLYALNAADGSLKWTHSIGLWNSPAIGADGTVYIGSYDHRVYALNPVDGTARWQYATGNLVVSSPAIGVDGTLYVGGVDHKVYALKSGDGNVEWSYTAGGEIAGSPAIGADGTVYIGSTNGRIYAFGGVGPSTYSISGTVTLSGAGLAGVTMTLTPGGKTATTASDGTYKFTDILEGTYTLTPTATGYVFSPAQRSVTVKALDVTAQDFTATGGLANSAWPKFRGNARNTGQSPYIGAQTNTLKWSYTTGFIVGSSAAVGADGTVYVGSLDGNVYALNPPGGGLKWASATGGGGSSPSIGADGTVYVGSYDDNIYALDPGSGTVKWSFPTGNVVYSSPALGTDGTIYIGSYDGKVYALNPADGSVRWSYTTGDHVSSSPAIGANGTVYIGSWDNKVYALDAADGTPKWSYATGGYVYSSPAIGVDGTIYVGSLDCNVYALDPAHGSVKWSCMTSGGVGSSCAISTDGTVYVGNDDAKVYALNPADGTVKWSYATGYRVYSSPAIDADGTVYVGSGDGKVYALNPADGSVKWSYTTGGDVYSSPAIGSDGTVYVGSDDGKVYAFGP